MTAFGLTERPFGRVLAELGERHGNLVFVEADLQRATETHEFEDLFPERYFNVGVAEANMVGLAAGLALSGKIAFCGTFACFMSQRVCDQVAISVAYCQTNVKMMGFDAGLTSGTNGASHQGVLDLAIMRAMPNISVFVPGDATETRAIMEYIVEHPGPVYMRAPRGKVPVILDPDVDAQFEPGRSLRLRDGNDVTIIACGIMVVRALQAADALAAEGLSARVVDMASLKPLDEEAVLSAAEDTGRIVTAENHSVFGGLGGAVAEVVTSHRPVPVTRVGIQDAFGQVGPVDWLADKYGISASHIAQAAREVVGRT